MILDKLELISGFFRSTSLRSYLVDTRLRSTQTNSHRNSKSSAPSTPSAHVVKAKSVFLRGRTRRLFWSWKRAGRSGGWRLFQGVLEGVGLKERIGLFAESWESGNGASVQNQPMNSASVLFKKVRDVGSVKGSKDGTAQSDLVRSRGQHFLPRSLSNCPRHWIYSMNFLFPTKRLRCTASHLIDIGEIRLQPDNHGLRFPGNQSDLRCSRQGPGRCFR